MSVNNIVTVPVGIAPPLLTPRLSAVLPCDASNEAADTWILLYGTALKKHLISTNEFRTLSRSMRGER
jgi:hypothetical protein